MLQKKYKPKIKLQIGENYKFVKDIVKDQNLNTVCAEANCPNIYECWNRGTATLMILGDTCTRACGFCAVSTAKPMPLEIDEPETPAFNFSIEGADPPEDDEDDEEDDDDNLLQPPSARVW